MEIGYIITIFLIGFVGSFISGMVGIGGSIIKYPMLLYLPPLFGIAAFTPHEVSGISAVQVFFATIAGVWAYRKDGYLNKALIWTMGSSVLVGSLLGSYGSTYFSGNTINIVYGVLALTAAIMMLLPKPGDVEGAVRFSKPLAAGLSFLVGIGSGIVGAAGAFLLVPIMLVVLKIPTRVTIASSLAITFISSIGATAGKVATGQVDYVPAAIMIIASVVASPVGAMLSKRVNVKVLQWLLAGLILATAVKIWWGII